MGWLTILFLTMSLLTGLAVWVYVRVQAAKEAGEQQHGGQEKSRSGGSGRSRRGDSLKDFWEVQDIQKGIVSLHPGGRYRLILRLMAQDFFLLSEIEQNNMEDSLAAAMRGLSFPIQTLATSEAMDTRQAVAALREGAGMLPEKIREHAMERAGYLENLRQSRAVTARRAYLVIPFDTSKGFEYARAELFARATSLVDALARAKVTVEMLDTGGACDFLAHLLNRGRAWRPSDAGEHGVMALYTISERQVASA